MVYACGFFANSGNYKGMGDSKIVPDLELAPFELIVTNSKAWSTENSTLPTLWPLCKKFIFSLNSTNANIGMAEAGINSYFSDNCTMKDATHVNEWLKEMKMEAYNCRTFKTIDENGIETFDIKLASKDLGNKKGITRDVIEYNGRKFVITRGYYSPLMALVVENLEKAKQYAANDNQLNMLNHYIDSFQSGSLDSHKDGSR